MDENNQYKATQKIIKRQCLNSKPLKNALDGLITQPDKTKERS